MRRPPMRPPASPLLIAPLLLIVALVLLVAVPAATQTAHLPLEDGSLRFAVIGDAGTGDDEQLAIASS